MKPDNARGLMANLWRQFVRTRRFVWHLLYQKEVDLVGFKDVSQPALIETPEEVQVEPLDAGNTDELRKFVYSHLEKYPDALRRFEDSLARKYNGVIARHNGAVIGFGWWVDHTMRHPQVEVLGLPIGREDVYGYDLFIGQEFRGRHAGLQYLIGCSRFFHARGYRRLYTIVRTDNLRSIKVQRQWGWQESGRRNVYTLLSKLIYCNGKLRWRNPVWF